MFNINITPSDDTSREEHYLCPIVRQIIIVKYTQKEFGSTVRVLSFWRLRPTAILVNIDLA